MSLTTAENQTFNLFQLCMSIRQFEKIIVEAFSSPTAKIIRQAFQEFEKACDAHMPKRAFLEVQYGDQHTAMGRHCLVCYDINRNQAIDGDSVWKPSHLHLSSIWSHSHQRGTAGYKRTLFPNEKFINEKIADHYKLSSGRRGKGTSHAQEELWWSLPHLEHYRNWYHMLDEYKAKWVGVRTGPDGRHTRYPSTHDALSFSPSRPLPCMVCIKHFMQIHT